MCCVAELWTDQVPWSPQRAAYRSLYTLQGFLLLRAALHPTWQATLKYWCNTRKKLFRYNPSLIFLTASSTELNGTCFWANMVRIAAVIRRREKFHCANSSVNSKILLWIAWFSSYCLIPPARIKNKIQYRYRKRVNYWEDAESNFCGLLLTQS